MGKKKRPTPREIEQLYDELPRVSQERNDFLLPQIVDLVQNEKWMNIRPEYQRRLVWDQKKKSRFIESLLMNIPVPPIFVYEHELSRYEVMDGQQRVNTILEFYNNTLKLRGLDTWAALNGFTRNECPEKIRRGLDRRRLSATVLLTESAGDSPDQAARLRREVFERLNTGGENLKAQELRNSLYAGSFNELLIELAGCRLFNDLWGMPRYEDHYDLKTGQFSAELGKNTLFKRMIDCELVLRFFAFRKTANVRGSVKSMLDRCMNDNTCASADEIDEMRNAFSRALDLSNRVFGKRAFQLKNEKGHYIHSQPLYDAVMIGMHRLESHADQIVAARRGIREALHKELEDEDNYAVVVGRANTAPAIYPQTDWRRRSVLWAAILPGIKLARARRFRRRLRRRAPEGQPTWQKTA